MKSRVSPTGQPLFVADQVEPDIALRWVDPHNLVIGANVARVFRFKRSTRLSSGGSIPVVIAIEPNIVRFI
jgi:hypothetical protein